MHWLGYWPWVGGSFPFSVSREGRGEVGGMVNKFVIDSGRKENKLMTCLLIFEYLVRIKGNMVGPKKGNRES